MYWRLNRVMYPVQNLGPGQRLAIWVQGCSLGCEDCISRDLWPATGGRDVDVARFAAEVINVSRNLDGITITGGEPLEQYRQLVAFCTFIKQKTDLGILVFSGFRLEELLEKFPDRLFTKCIDNLVDGPFIRDFHDSGKMRGSSNQRMFRFDYKEKEGRNHKVEIREVEIPTSAEPWSVKMDEENNLFMTGIPGRGEAGRVEELMKASGIDFEF